MLMWSELELLRVAVVLHLLLNGLFLLHSLSCLLTLFVVMVLASFLLLLWWLLEETLINTRVSELIMWSSINVMNLSNTVLHHFSLNREFLFISFWGVVHASILLVCSEIIVIIIKIIFIHVFFYVFLVTVLFIFKSWLTTVCWSVLLVRIVVLLLIIIFIVCINATIIVVFLVFLLLVFRN